jgi:hypothetical protein
LAANPDPRRLWSLTWRKNYDKNGKKTKGEQIKWAAQTLHTLLGGCSKEQYHNLVWWSNESSSELQL